MKENFYHGVLLGILCEKQRWSVSSKPEMGEGYADILVWPDTWDTGILIEVTYAHDGDLDAACKKALNQIAHTGYEDGLAVSCLLKTLTGYGIQNQILKQGQALMA